MRHLEFIRLCGAAVCMATLGTVACAEDVRFPPAGYSSFAVLPTAIPGVLTYPTSGTPPVPAVVIVHGSGGLRKWGPEQHFATALNGPRLSAAKPGHPTRTQARMVGKSAACSSRGAGCGASVTRRSAGSLSVRSCPSPDGRCCGGSQAAIRCARLLLDDPSNDESSMCVTRGARCGSHVGRGRGAGTVRGGGDARDASVGRAPSSRVRRELASGSRTRNAGGGARLV